MIATLLVVLAMTGWQFGLFYRYNYVTANVDCWKNAVCLVTTEPPDPCGARCVGLKEKYGFHEVYVGCNLSDSEMRGIDAYNAEVERYLNKRNGGNWRKKYESERNSTTEDKALK